jgi:hypothetical protein
VTTLHTVNKHSLSSDLLASCLRVARAGDCILLIEDGAYNVKTLADAATAQGCDTFAVAMLCPACRLERKRTFRERPARLHHCRRSRRIRRAGLCSPAIRSLVLNMQANVHMSCLVLADQRRIPLDNDGYLRSLDDWDEDVATSLATAASVQLSPAHWEIIHLSARNSMQCTWAVASNACPGEIHWP